MSQRAPERGEKLEVVQTVHRPLVAVNQVRITCAQGILGLNYKKDNSSSKIIMSGETLFDLCGYVNKKNYRFWGIEKSRITLHEEPLHADFLLPQLYRLGLENMWYQQDTAEPTIEMLRVVFRLISDLVIYTGQQVRLI